MSLDVCATAYDQWLDAFRRSAEARRKYEEQVQRCEDAGIQALDICGDVNGQSVSPLKAGACALSTNKARRECQAAIGDYFEARRLQRASDYWEVIIDRCVQQGPQQ
jgi:hypothetical protein